MFAAIRELLEGYKEKNNILLLKNWMQLIN